MQYVSDPSNDCIVVLLYDFNFVQIRQSSRWSAVRQLGRSTGHSSNLRPRDRLRYQQRHIWSGTVQQFFSSISILERLADSFWKVHRVEENCFESQAREKFYLNVSKRRISGQSSQAFRVIDKIDKRKHSTQLNTSKTIVEAIFHR